MDTVGWEIERCTLVRLQPTVGFFLEEEEICMLAYRRAARNLRASECPFTSECPLNGFLVCNPLLSPVGARGSWEMRPRVTQVALAERLVKQRMTSAAARVLRVGRLYVRILPTCTVASPVSLSHRGPPALGSGQTCCQSPLSHSVADKTWAGESACVKKM